MDKDFKFALTDEEKAYLRDLARLAITKGLNNKNPEADMPAPPTPTLMAPLGAFVTIKRGGKLRGCIGSLVTPEPLFVTVTRMASAAAFNDPRFPALRAEEFADIELEISIMGPITPCKDTEKIIIGRHGLIMKQGGRQGLLLPQVPVEWNWNKEEFLRHTCNKAGLPLESWQQAWKDGTTELYWFEAEII